MNKLIIVPLPLNVTGETIPLFKPYQSYEIRQQKVKKFRNVFVANSGFCLNNKGLIKECHHKHSHQYADYQNEATRYYYDVIDHPENLVTLDDDNLYLIIHHPWFNYYHWICECIFRLWMVRNQFNDLVLVLPEHYRHADFIMGSLEPFKIKNIFYIPNGKSLVIRNVCLPQIKAICDSYNARQLKQVSNFYRNYVIFEKKVPFKPIDKLYISRELAGRRKIINEEEVQVIMKKYGFTIFHPESFPFLEQVAIFSAVKYLVGTHGSGLTNLLFMSKNTSVLELHKNKTNELDHPSPLFWYMAGALQVKYFHQVCETHGKEDYFEGDYNVDNVLLEKNIVKMLSN